MSIQEEIRANAVELIQGHPHAPEKVEEHPSPRMEQPLRLKKEDYYQSFSEWLKNDIKEVTKVIALGGGLFRSHRGKPDVISIFREESVPLKTFSIIVTAKINMENTNSELISGFKQACAFKAFCHKIYFVIPTSSNESDISGIESLCSNSGIGLVLFDNTDKENPCYELKYRATEHSPAPWYTYDNPPLVENILFN